MEKQEYLDWLNQYTDAEACMEAQQSLPYYIRVNTLKTTTEEYLNWTKLKLNPTLLPYAFQVQEPPKGGLGNTMDYATGWMHTQSLSSMLPPHFLNPKPGEKVLIASFGSGAGSDALCFEITKKIKTAVNKAPVTSVYVNRAIRINYSEYARWRKKIVKE